MAPTPSLRHLAATVRGRRQDLGLTQGELAARAGVSRPWLSELEGGKATAEIGLVLRVVDALGLRMELRAPDVADAAPERQPVDLDALLDDYEAEGDGSRDGGGTRADGPDEARGDARGGSHAARDGNVDAFGGSRDAHTDASGDPHVRSANDDA
jgi:HTH-type transcriptional regulator/antitoxin HipB